MWDACVHGHGEMRCVKLVCVCVCTSVAREDVVYISGRVTVASPMCTHHNSTIQ